MKPMNFRKLNIINPLIRASTEAGFGSPTEIQSRIIPKIILKKDIFGCIENEGEKMASFVIPIIQQLKKNTVEYRNIRVLIITANTESAENIDESFNTFSKYLPISKLSILDDEPQGSQIYKMRKGKDILIATPSLWSTASSRSMPATARPCGPAATARSCRPPPPRSSPPSPR